MAEDGVLPRVFLAVNPRTQVQPAGLLLFGLTMLVPAFLLGSFEKLLNYVLFTDALTLLTVASTLFALRKRGAGGEGVFRIPGYPVVPALYLLCLLGVAAHIAVAEMRLAVAGTAIILTGWPLFFLGRRLSRSRP
jgi:APA family basic amino acid/polyamine antiporter